MGASLHGSYGEAVDGSRKGTEVVQLAGYTMGPRPKTDGGKAVIRLSHQVVAIVCKVDQLPVIRWWLASTGLRWRVCGAGPSQQSGMLLTVVSGETVAVGWKTRET